MSPTEYFSHDGNFFLIFEKLECSLFKFIRAFKMIKERPLDEFETGYLIREVLIGLHFIYQRNVIHRDVSADNILMDSFGNLFISDFGQAAMLSNRRPVRDSIKGKPGLADPRLE